MTKKLLFSALVLTLSGTLQAATISPKEALARAGKAGILNTRAITAPRLSFTKTTEVGKPAVYVFNNDDEGFLVLSADDIAYPVLGYSDNGRLTAEDIASNPALEWWLSEYARQIEYASKSGNVTASNSLSMPTTRGDREAIEPMIKTSWDQGAPFNNQCPLLGVDRTYTGCVATAMAQVMNYWKYPEVGQGQIGYEATSIGKRLTLNFGKKKFDWDNMLPFYYGRYTDAQADAVAYLMKACGYAVKMDYGTDSSGALAMNIVSGLKKYFNYDPNMLYTLREYYPTTQWSDMIYDNLKNVGPILYGGGSMLGGGHSFICDGYDGNGMYHFNWGWTGMSDGYFSLDALNPESLGAGGGGGGGYNFTQDAVFGIQPPTGKPEEVRPMFISQMGSLGAGINPEEPGMLHFELWGESGAMWVNYNASTVKVGFGAIFEPQGTTGGETIKIPVSDIEFTIQPGYGTAPEYFDPQVNLATAGLKDGTYKVTMASFDCNTENPEWIPVKTAYNYYNYVTLKKNGKDYEVDVNDLAGLGIGSAQIVGDFYYGCPVRVRATIVNNFDIELSSGFAPAFAFDGTVCFLGESVLVTVPPHSRVTKEWVTPIYPMEGAPSIVSDTKLLFTFFDEMTYNLYTDDYLKEVTMKANPGTPLIDYGNVPPVITGATLTEEEINGETVSVYHVQQGEQSSIDVGVTLTLRSGYFNYPVYAMMLLPPDSDSPNGYMSIENYSGQIMQLSRRKPTSFSASLNILSAKTDVLYSIGMGYEIMAGMVAISGPMAYLRVVSDNASVDSVMDDSENLKVWYDPIAGCIRAASDCSMSLIDIYDMQGNRVASAGEGRDTLRVDGLKGVVIVHAADSNGKTTSLKVKL